MFGSLARAIFGTANDRSLKTYQKRVPEIGAHEDAMRALSDEGLRGQTAALRARLAAGETLDDLMAEAFATCREASRRVLGMRHFDVQLIGGMVLHSGRIAEMKTGEGKTLVATLAVYLNALAGQGVHVVTVNEYLARRDADEMGRLYAYLGLTTGVIVPGIGDDERRAAYASDVTYGTNNEFGFDYLRDNMKYRLEDMVQRPFFHAIVDEVDSILIDEARTPLIISGPAEDSSDLYRSVDAVMRGMIGEEGIYEKDEKFRTVTLTELGSERAEERLREAGVLSEGDLYDVFNISIVHHVTQSLRAHTLFGRDDHYIVRNDQVIIIDEFTGRMMEGRRFSEGLHQALEAKEGVTIQQENQTLASITFQNYFRLYPKLSGMTGTAMTEADEFAEIYRLDVVEIPTNVAVARRDEDDEVYLTAAEKNEAIAALIGEAQGNGQPVLVGTTSIEKSEALSAILAGKGVQHSVLNARFHEQEASIIAQAGAPSRVTIATNMAGRGTDIKLGGNLDMRLRQELAAFSRPADAIESGTADEGRLAEAEAGIREDVRAKHDLVVGSGGLFVIGTERHESRRIDNQLRGRSGRQGDPGASRFFLSLDDDLMRIFGSDRMAGMMQRLGLKEGEAIVHPWINKALERAQKKVEARNFDTRKNLLKYDDVMNDQRKEVYGQRREFMSSDDVSETIAEMRGEIVGRLVDAHLPERAFPEQWESAELAAGIERIFGLSLPVPDWSREEGIDREAVRSRIEEAAASLMAGKAASYGGQVLRFVEKQVLLNTLDGVWKEHLLLLDQLRQGIYLRAHGQRDPLNEYKREAFQLFGAMLDELRERVTSMLAHVEIATEPANAADPFPAAAPPGRAVPFASGPAPFAAPSPPAIPTAAFHPAAAGFAADMQGDDALALLDPDDPASWRGLSRNATCPCGSGRKYKHCHGRLE